MGEQKKATTKKRRTPKGVRRHRSKGVSSVGQVGNSLQVRWYPSSIQTKVDKVLSAYDEPED